METFHWKHGTPVVVLVTALAGCAGPSPDGGFGLARSTAQERLGLEAAWARTPEEAHALRTRTRALLAKPLSADDAVQVALFNNPGLQANYASLGVSESELGIASRIDNPRFSFLRVINPQADVKIESILSFGVMSLITLPQRMEAANRRFEAARRNAAADMLGVAADTRKAWVRAVAAAQTVRYMEQVQEAAEAGAELARRMATAGNFSRLSQLREQSFHADAATQLALARERAVGAREQLTRLMGLDGADAAGFTLPQRLPDLPPAPRAQGEVARSAGAERLDIAAARLEAEGLAASLGATRTTRFTNSLEIGRARVDEGQEPRKHGWEIGFEIPLFDWGSARIAGAEARYLQATERIRETAVNAESEVREAYAVYGVRHALAKHHRDEVVPLRKKISDEMLLRYNGMLKSVFELIADAREQVLAVNAAIEAQRDFWLADAALNQALIGKPASIGSSLGLSRELNPGAAATRAGH